MKVESIWYKVNRIPTLPPSCLQKVKLAFDANLNSPILASCHPLLPWFHKKTSFIITSKYEWVKELLVALDQSACLPYIKEILREHHLPIHEEHLAAFCLLHELGHIWVVRNTPYIPLIQMEGRSSEQMARIRQQYVDFGLSMVEVQRRYRKVEVEKQADEFALKYLPFYQL